MPPAARASRRAKPRAAARSAASAAPAAPARVSVYFATNRKKQGPGAADYGHKIVLNDPAAVVYAVAVVVGTDLSKEASGSIASVTDLANGDFSPAVKKRILASKKNLLFFIHGFANSFTDGIKRAAFNREWFAAAGVAAADTTVIAFSWPSKGQVVALPPHMPTDDYYADQTRAGQSGLHLAYFFKNADALIKQFRTQNPNGRVFLLAHSMGNYALQSAVQFFFGMGAPGGLIFDEVILPAADERYDTFLRPVGGRLSNLHKMTRRITTYCSEHDAALIVANGLNFKQRLGFDGPKHKDDQVNYPPSKYRLVEVTKVDDYHKFSPLDASHQYYRRSRKVRADIAAVMAGTAVPPGGEVKLKTP